LTEKKKGNHFRDYPLVKNEIESEDIPEKTEDENTTAAFTFTRYAVVQIIFAI